MKKILKVLLTKCLGASIIAKVGFVVSFFLKDFLFLSLIEYVTQVNGNKRYFVPNLYLKSECFNCYHKMNLFESPLSRDLLLISSSSVA